MDHAPRRVVRDVLVDAVRVARSVRKAADAASRSDATPGFTHSNTVKGIAPTDAYQPGPHPFSSHVASSLAPLVHARLWADFVYERRGDQPWRPRVLRLGTRDGQALAETWRRRLERPGRFVWCELPASSGQFITCCDKDLRSRLGENGQLPVTEPMLWSLYHTTENDGERIAGMLFVRGATFPDFGLRERSLVRFAHEAVVLRTSAASNGDESVEAIVADLPPRLRQTLHHVLSGLLEPEIAEEMRLSPHTIHGYIKALYTRFGVKNRPQLMAKWIN